MKEVRGTSPSGEVFRLGSSWEFQSPQEKESAGDLSTVKRVSSEKWKGPSRTLPATFYDTSRVFREGSSRYLKSRRFASRLPQFREEGIKEEALTNRGGDFPNDPLGHSRGRSLSSNIKGTLRKHKLADSVAGLD